MLKLIKTFALFQRSKNGNYNLLIISILLSAVIPIVSSSIAPYFYAEFISHLEHNTISHAITWENAVEIGVISYAAMLFIAYIIQVVQLYLITALESKAMQRIDDATAKHLLTLSHDFFKDNFTGSLVSKQTAFSGLYERLFDTICWDIVPTITIFLASIFIILSYSWILALILLVYSLTYFIITYTLSNKVRPLQDKLARARTAHSGVISDQISNIQTIKLFGRDQEEVDYYRTQNEHKTRIRTATWFKDQNYRSISNGLIMIINIVMIVVCYILWAQSKIDLGEVILTLTYNRSISDRMWQIGGIIKTLRTIKADSAEMMEILEVKQTVKDVDQPIACTINAGNIVINKIDFSYPGTEKKVFDQFSLTIPAGQKVGIVGESGSGKSTLMHLLMRMMDIQSGTITIDGIPIDRVRQSELRQSMSIVPQDTVLFHRTVYENIAYDKPGATSKEVIAAAKKAQAHCFISSLASNGDSGYDVKVGERGIKLSGGQRQRIGLARAFLQHKPLLILDEATSSLDSISEKEIQRALETLLHEQGTMIIIAHRLSTVHQLDRIIVMNQGKIIEDGTPDELYGMQHGAYRKLINAQQLVIN